MKRIQRKRVKGWRMPPNTVYVGRPSKWGNPFCTWIHPDAVELYEDWLRGELVGRPDFLDELKGKDLACWCALGRPCHADVILKILAEKEESEVDRSARKDAWEVYKALVKPAREAYEAVAKQAWEAYQAVDKPAWEAYLAVVEQAWVAYEVAIRSRKR